jgi:hypothetical protein
MSETIARPRPVAEKSECKLCIHGHEMTPENTYKDGSCLTCRRIRTARMNEAVRERRAQEARAASFFAQFPDVHDHRDIARLAAILEEKEARISRRRKSGK